MEQLQQISHNIDSELSHNIPMENLTSEQEQEFYLSEICHIVEKPFTPAFF